MNGKIAKVIRKLTDNAPHGERRALKRLWSSLPHRIKGLLHRRMALELRSPSTEVRARGPYAMAVEHVSRCR